MSAPGPRSRRGQGRRPCRSGRSVDRCWSWCRSSDVVRFRSWPCPWSSSFWNTSGVRLEHRAVGNGDRRESRTRSKASTSRTIRTSSSVPTPTPASMSRTTAPTSRVRTRRVRRMAPGPPRTPGDGRGDEPGIRRAVGAENEWGPRAPTTRIRDRPRCRRHRRRVIFADGDAVTGMEAPPFGLVCMPVPSPTRSWPGPAPGPQPLAEVPASNPPAAGRGPRPDHPRCRGVGEEDLRPHRQAGIKGIMIPTMWHDAVVRPREVRYLAGLP